MYLQSACMLLYVVLLSIKRKTNLRELHAYDDACDHLGKTVTEGKFPYDGLSHGMEGRHDEKSIVKIREATQFLFASLQALYSLACGERSDILMDRNFIVD